MLQVCREDRSGRCGVRPPPPLQPEAGLGAGVGWAGGRARPHPIPTHTACAGQTLWPAASPLEQPGSPGCEEERALSQAAAESRNRALGENSFFGSEAVPFLEAESPGSDAVSPAEATAAPGGGAGSRAPSSPGSPGDAPSVRLDGGEGLPAALLVREARSEPAGGVASPLLARRTGP